MVSLEVTNNYFHQRPHLIVLIYSCSACCWPLCSAAASCSRSSSSVTSSSCPPSSPATSCRTSSQRWRSRTLLSSWTPITGLRGGCSSTMRSGSVRGRCQYSTGEAGWLMHSSWQQSWVQALREKYFYKVLIFFLSFQRLLSRHVREHMISY